MRRKRSHQTEPVKSRSGVMHSVTIKKFSVQRPQPCSIAATGSAPSETPSTPKAPAVRRSAGSRQAAKTAGFASHRVAHISRASASEIFPQVHPRIEAGNFGSIAVERQRGASRRKQPGADLPLGRLAPARMINLRVHVREKTIFAGRGQRPRRSWRPFEELDADDRLDPFESVFPG